MYPKTMIHTNCMCKFHNKTIRVYLTLNEDWTEGKQWLLPVQRHLA